MKKHAHLTKFQRITAGIGSLLALCICSCLQDTTPVPSPSALTTETAPSQEYLLGPEDVVEILVWKNPDLSRVVTVRPDGKISLPLIGDVQASGHTAVQLAEGITEKLKTYYKEPAQVSIIVQQVNSYAIYVLGEVRKPGRYVVKSGTTFIQLITLAGGFTEFASPSKITILRKDNDHKDSTLPIRYKDAVAGKNNVILKPNDSVIVP